MKTIFIFCSSLLFVFNCVAQEVPQPKKPSKFSISAGAGFGFRTAKVSPNLESQEYEDEKSMLTGISFFIAPRYQLNDTYSIGINYRQFSASKNNSDYSIVGANIYANQKRNIYYIGPSLHYHYIQEHAELNGFMSVGYIGFVGDIDIFLEGKHFRTTTLTGANLGIEIGLEYLWRIAPNLYAGASFGYTMGALSKIKEKTGSDAKTIKLEDDEREGLQFLNINPVIRWYL